MKHGAWLARLALVASTAFTLARCSPKTTAAGLEVIVQTDLSPSAYASIWIQVSQQTGLSWTSLVNEPLSGAAPFRFAIAPGPSPDQDVLITVTAYATDGASGSGPPPEPVVRRIEQVQVPRTYVAQLDIELSATQASCPGHWVAGTMGAPTTCTVNLSDAGPLPVYRDGGSSFDAGPRPVSRDGGGSFDTGLADTGRCASGACIVTLAVDYVEQPVGIAVDRTSVYWTEYVGGNVMKVSIDGGRAVTLASGRNAPYGIAVDGMVVCWTEVVANLVLELPVSGGAMTTFAPGNGQQGNGPLTVRLLGSDVYWGGGGGVVRAAGARPAVTYYDAAAMDMAVDDGGVYWLGVNAGQGKGVNVGDGGTPTLIGPSPDPWNIALDTHGVYWTDIIARAVLKVPRGGGAVVTLTPAQGEPLGIAVDDANIYWVDHALGTVMKVSLDGGTPVTLVTAQGHPYAIALDGTSVYWTNTTPEDGGLGGGVMKAAK